MKVSQETSSEALITLNDVNGKINAWSPKELFDRYIRCGFLYPEKRQKLIDYLPLIEENWAKAMRAGENIMWTASIHDQEKQAWASVGNWRSTMGSWVWQHLVSDGNPVYPLLIMLGVCTKVIGEAYAKPYHSCQNWFRPNNKYANKVFGYIIQSIREDAVYAENYCYSIIQTNQIPLPPNRMKIEQITNRNSNMISGVINKWRGRVFSESEELDTDDIELKELNGIYKRFGLSRQRHIYAVWCSSHKEPAGILLAHRAPFGLNFSLLENLSDIVLNPELDPSEKPWIVSNLLTQADNIYSKHYPAPYFPLVTEIENREILEAIGIQAQRIYTRFIWQRDGLPDWYEGLSKISKPALQRWRKTHLRQLVHP